MLVFLTLKGTLKQSTVCCGMSKNSTWSVYFSQFQNLWWIQLLRLLNDSTKEKFLFGCFKPLSSSWSPVDSCSQWVAQPATSDYWLFSTGLLQATAINPILVNFTTIFTQFSPQSYRIWIPGCWGNLFEAPNFRTLPGVELGLNRVPFAQKLLIRKALCCRIILWMWDKQTNWQIDKHANTHTHCGVIVSRKCEWCHSRRLISWVAWQ